jgi:hypothetical protein
MMSIACAPESPEAILFLPICHLNLDPANIPSACELDAILCNSDTEDLPKGPFLALEIIHFLPNVARQALEELWPRVLAWVTFLDAHRGVMGTSPNQLDLYWFFFDYVHRLPPVLVGASSGFRQLVAKAWTVFIATGDSDARGFRQLLHFVDGDSRSRAMCDDADDAHLVEYAAGAGGSLDDLAGMVCDHLNIDGNMAYIQSAICFVMASGSAQDFHHFLRRRGIVRRLTEILSDLTVDSSSDPRIRNVAEGLVTDCLSLLVFELCNPDAYLWLPQALRSGLLDCIARISTLWPGAHVLNLRKLLEYTQSATVYFSVVQSFACHLPTTSVRADSPIYAQWMEFLALAQERLAPADAFYAAPERGPRRVCDNLRVKHLIFSNTPRSC